MMFQVLDPIPKKGESLPPERSKNPLRVMEKMVAGGEKRIVGKTKETA